MAAAGAGPVYELLGKKDLGTSDFPPIETTLIDGDVAFRQHSGGHTPGPNWPTFLTFAERYFDNSPVDFDILRRPATRTRINLRRKLGRWRTNIERAPKPRR